MWNDFRFAFRTLRRTPIFSVVVVLTLALGIGAASAIFSLFYQVLLRSLPVPNPDQLVVLHATGPGLPGGMSSQNNETVFSYPMYARLRDTASLFDGLAALSATSVELSNGNIAQSGDAELISGNYFGVLRIRPALGRLVAPADDQIGHPNQIAVLSYRYWMRSYGGAPTVLNQKILLNSQPFVVVGVAPPDFSGFTAGDPVDVFVPLSLKDRISGTSNSFNQPGSQWMNIIGRLKTGVSIQQAGASLRPLWTATLRDHVDRIGVKNPVARRLYLAKQLDLHTASGGISNLEARWRKPLSALLAMVGLLLLIACANVASLFVARAVSQSRETAVRVAVGAGRWQVTRHTFAESFVLAVLAGAFGTALSFALVRLLVAELPQSDSGSWLTAAPDAHVLAFSLVLVLCTTMLFGVLPAFQNAKIDPMPVLREQGANVSGGSTVTRWRRALVAGQLALSLSLLVGAGLFARSLVHLLSHDSGFRPDHLVVLSTNPRLSGYSLERGRALYRELLDRLTQLPGVESVSVAEFSPLSNSEASTNVSVEGFTSRTPDDANADTNTVGPSYFRTLGTPLIQGREFTDADRQGSQKVAIVNQAFVKRFLPTRRPLQTRMTVGAGHPLDMTIVGVVQDTQNLNLRDPAKPMYFTPFDQSYAKATQIRHANFLVRTRMDVGAVERSVRPLLASIDSKLPVTVKPMEQFVSDSVSTERLSAVLASVFGALALFLAAVGLYGVIAYSVARRTTEIGIRLALGALPSQILKLIALDIALVALSGILVGIPAAYALTQLMKSQLYGISGDTAGIFASSSAILLLVAALATLVPVYRAATVDPKTALRYE